jgi:CRP/FNR family transcriptional regulator
MPDSLKPKLKIEGNILKNVPFFSTLSPEAVSEVERFIVRKHYAKDQVVLLEEETAAYMYLVYSGKVRVVQLHEEGREQILTIHKKNDFFGEMSLLDGKTAPATVIAHEESVIGLLSKKDFEQHLLSNEDIRKKIINLLCERLRDSWDMIKILSFDNAEHRVMAVLKRLQDLYGITDDRGSLITVRLTHQQMANYASVARETVTRVLNRLEKDEAILVLEGKSILLTKAFYDKLNGFGLS